MEYFSFQWHITEACDQRCRHCYIYALGSHAKFKEMALEDMVTVMENCKTFCEKAGKKIWELSDREIAIVESLKN